MLASSTYRLFELEKLVELTWEAINKETTIAVSPALICRVLMLLESLLDGVAKQTDGHFHRHNLAILDVLGNHCAELGARASLLSAEEITRYMSGHTHTAQVHETVVTHETRTLRPLPRTGATEDENHDDLLSVKLRSGTWRAHCVLLE